MLKLYLKKVPHNLGFDVMAYKESECLKPVVRWQWYMTNKPDKRYKRVMYNCCRWEAVWVE